MITSADNSLVRRSRRLTKKKYRDRTGTFLLEGEKLIAEAAAAGRVEWILVDGGQDRAAALRARHPDWPAGLRIADLSPRLFAGIAQTVTSQGLAAVVRKEERPLPVTAGSNYVVLDRLQDPGNIGAILRTAEAAGFAGAIAVRGTGDLFAPKTVRAAAGAMLRLPTAVMDDADAVCDWLEAAGKRVVTTSLDAARRYDEVDLHRDIALVIGNEGNGISARFAERGQISIKIPMQGAVESLNAAVAAGILMYQTIRKDSVEE